MTGSLLRSIALALASAAFFITAGTSGASAQDGPTRAITHLAGDVYRFQNDRHFSVFMVTSEGIVATDPINADAAAWLEAELDSRFGQPVKYLIYSHDHADHISGGEVFADTATVIAQENARKHIVENSTPTAAPDLTFRDAMTVTLGGKSVELSYLGPNHGDSVIVMRFPEEGILFAVDVVTADRLPWRDLPGADIDAWIGSLKAIEAMDFAILSPGHGRVGTRDDVAPHRRYMEDLRAQVAQGMQQGKSLDEIRQSVDLSAYKDFGEYDNWLSLNIEGMHRYLSEQAG
ncbi:MAG: MBL fold metallo-hydrolase [Rhodospirillaceae bacterium]|nr:MBL fold metallo-hydrolase [Rhodospirillaceae bacterium]